MKSLLDTRQAVLNFFHADPAEYDVIFTSGATAAIRILQHYRWGEGQLLLTADNHNSVNGLREDAHHVGAIVQYAPIKEDLTIDFDQLDDLLH